MDLSSEKNLKSIGYVLANLWGFKDGGVIFDIYNFYRKKRVYISIYKSSNNYYMYMIEDWLQSLDVYLSFKKILKSIGYVLAKLWYIKDRGVMRLCGFACGASRTAQRNRRKSRTEVAPHSPFAENAAHAKSRTHRIKVAHIPATIVDGKLFLPISLISCIQISAALPTGNTTKSSTFYAINFINYIEHFLADSSP